MENELESTVSALLDRKGLGVVSIDREASILEAARWMKARKIGALVVTHERTVEGLLTERDVMHRVVCAGRNPAEVTAGQVMTRSVPCCQPETTLAEVRRAFKERFVRYLPVLDDQGRLVGLISIGDVNAFQADAQEAELHFLYDYLYSYS